MQKVYEIPARWNVVNPLNVTVGDAAGYATGQGYHDEEHLAALTASMRADGWQGAPLVVLPDYGIAYSGSHRLAAAEEAELEIVPCVDLRDLFEACKLDLDALLEEHDLGLISDRAAVADLLPAEIATAYGINDLDENA